MQYSWDEAKRHRTLSERGLDFADAAEVFAGRRLTFIDDRREYSEDRYGTIGLIGPKIVMVIWTPRDGGRRIISLRACNAEERERFYAGMDRP